MADRRTFYKNLYSLFFNAPTRRTDNILQTKTTKLPLKIFSHRQVESQQVADRVTDI